MKAKIIATSAIVLALVSYAFAIEGVDCNVTISSPCHAAQTPTGPVTAGCDPLTGFYSSAGNNIDQCVTSYGALGANGCKNETQTFCRYSTFFILCNGSNWGYTDHYPLVTPTEIDGPCK